MSLKQAMKRTALHKAPQTRGRSGYERFLRKDIDAWTRGLHFTWIAEGLGVKWHGYDQFLFFRGSREWYVEYAPFFWRNTHEFLKFEKTFIKRATARKRGMMSERDFIRQARSMKARLNLAAIQGPILAAAGAGTGAVAVTATRANKIRNLGDTLNAAKCLMAGDEEACIKAISGWAARKAAIPVLKR